MRQNKHIPFLLLLALSSILFLAFGHSCTAPLPTLSVTELPIPAEIKGNMVGDTKVFSLELKKGSKEFIQGKTTETWGINASFLGPTIRVKKGEKIELQVKNSIGEVTTLHWHGLHIPAKMDGGPHQVIQPDTTWKPSFTIMQRASLNWYHPHLEGKTGIHVYMGLAGMFIIDDEHSEKLGIPKDYGIDDIPLVIQDRNFNEDGSFRYVKTNMEFMVGVKGEHVLVNGAILPTWNAPAQWVRFRILNGSNGRIYNLGLSNNKKFYQIATEGGLLAKPVELTRLLVAPGERAEIIVDLSQEKDQKISIISYSSETTVLLDKHRKDGGMHADSKDKMDYILMNISVSKPAVHSYTLPAQLIVPDKLVESDATHTRKFELNVKGEMGTAQEFTINDQVMKMSRIDEMIKLGTTEIWEIKNVSEMPHPFHIHDITFLILDRDGKPPAPHEQGWKDTVLVQFDQTVRVIAKFEHFSDPVVPYMYHCHILEHEDKGMMGQFVVIP